LTAAKFNEGGVALANRVADYYDWVKGTAGGKKSVYTRQNPVFGFDVEEGWSVYWKTIAVMDGYDGWSDASHPRPRPMLDFGAAENGSCDSSACTGGSDWTRAHRLEVAWGNRHAPCPQIYSAIMSGNWWIPLEQYANTHGGLMNFYCVMTEKAPGTFTPSRGWIQLHSDLADFGWGHWLRRRLTKIRFTGS